MCLRSESRPIINDQHTRSVQIQCKKRRDCKFSIENTTLKSSEKFPTMAAHYSSNCPRRVLVQTAKTRGGTLESPAYREKNYGVPEKISIFENTARKGLPKVRWGSNKQAKDSGSVLYTTRF